MLDLASGVLDQWTAGRAARDRQMKALTFPLDILGSRSMQIAWTSLMFYVLLCMRSGPHSLGSHIVHTADICVEAEEQRRALCPRSQTRHRWRIMAASDGSSWSSLIQDSLLQGAPVTLTSTL